MGLISGYQRLVQYQWTESTKYYYSIVPTLADVFEKTTSSSFDEIVPEVPDYE